MKNIIVSIFIFFLLCLCLFLIDSNIVNVLTYISKTSTQIESLIEENNLEEAKVLSKELYDTLEIKDLLTSVYLNHSEYDILSDEATKVYIYLQENEIPDTLSALRILKNNAENLLELQKINLKNIF